MSSGLCPFPRERNFLILFCLHVFQIYLKQGAEPLKWKTDWTASIIFHFEKCWKKFSFEYFIFLNCSVLLFMQILKKYMKSSEKKNFRIAHYLFVFWICKNGAWAADYKNTHSKILSLPYRFLSASAHVRKHAWV